MNNQSHFKELINYFMTLDNHYLGCQDELFNGECHMFANKSYARSGRGNIRFLENNTILCFYLPYAKTNEKEKDPVVSVSRMPKWFQDIYNRILEMRLEQGVVNRVKKLPRVTSIQQVSTKKKPASNTTSLEIEKIKKREEAKKEEEAMEQQMDLFSFG
ncbi:hypothetical protein [Priestia megaterium]|uniref:Uncharacterized protein n=1 Tax=Priestia megaterium TaxID=1404 RepID=A0A6M6E5Y4_PRIMG|nr:hypothetical protein [Priestia megaterium]QJX80934.1 hypothetical protein FDZ14_33115 [Priestia megaterium]